MQNRQNRSEGFFKPKSESDSAPEHSYGCLPSANYENTDRYVSVQARNKLAAFLGKKPHKEDKAADATIVVRPTV
jgi:hypothetical protein